MLFVFVVIITASIAQYRLVVWFVMFVLAVPIKISNLS